MPEKIGTLIKTFKGTRTTETGLKYSTLLLFYRDENGKKKTIFYDRPTFDYYILKDKKSDEAINPPLYISLDKVEKHTTYYDNLFKDVAVNTGALPFYDKVKFNYGVSSYNMNNLLKHSLLYEADINLEDFYISKFYREFKKDPNYKLKKCYFDIENDIYKYQGGFPNPKIAPCPVCLITLIDESEMHSYTFILRNESNKQLTDFEKDVNNFKIYMNNKIKEVDNLDLSFSFDFYNSEIDLISAFFNKVHELDPDYIGGWNISFDCQTLINRLKNLYKEEKIQNYQQEVPNTICDEKYMFQTNESGKEIYMIPRAYYSEGRGKTGTRVDSFSILDGINWTDQMLSYAITHVSGGKPDSYALDNIADIELGKEKLPFGEGETIRNQLYKNTKRFVEYNIRDVLLLLEMEDTTKDIDTIQQLSDITLTRKEKVFKKSIALTNYVNAYAYEQNLVMRTNKNTKYGEESDYYNTNYLNANSAIQEYDKEYLTVFGRKDKNGAYVSNPELNDNVGIEVIANKLSKYIFDFVCDEDFSSLYPSIIRALNLDSLNIIGKFYLIDDEINNKLKKYGEGPLFKIPTKNKQEEEEDEESDDENTVVEETKDSSIILSDILSSRDYVKLGEMYFNLPSSEEVISDILKRKSVI